MDESSRHGYLLVGGKRRRIRKGFQLFVAHKMTLRAKPVIVAEFEFVQDGASSGFLHTDSAPDRQKKIVILH